MCLNLGSMVMIGEVKEPAAISLDAWELSLEVVVVSIGQRAEISQVHDRSSHGCHLEQGLSISTIQEASVINQTNLPCTDTVCALIIRWFHYPPESQFIRAGNRDHVYANRPWIA